MILRVIPANYQTYTGKKKKKTYTGRVGGGLLLKPLSLYSQVGQKCMDSLDTQGLTQASEVRITVLWD